MGFFDALGKIAKSGAEAYMKEAGRCRDALDKASDYSDDELERKIRLKSGTSYERQANIREYKKRHS